MKTKRMFLFVAILFPLILGSQMAWAQQWQWQYHVYNATDYDDTNYDNPIESIIRPIEIHWAEFDGYTFCVYKINGISDVPPVDPVAVVENVRYDSSNFIDKNIEFGKLYTYWVEANNGSDSKVARLVIQAQLSLPKVQVTATDSSFIINIINWGSNTDYWTEIYVRSTNFSTVFTAKLQGSSYELKSNEGPLADLYEVVDGTPLDSKEQYIIRLRYHSEISSSKSLFSAPDTFTLTTSDIIEISSLPRVMPVLSQNYPNPFNPETTISYSIAKVGQVKLVVYNVLGQKVATLVDEYKTANVHHVTFNASDLTSGVYLYKLVTEDGFVETKKMILAK